MTATTEALRHVIGTSTQIQFKVRNVGFDGAKTTKNLAGSYIYFELQRAGTQILTKDNDGVGGVTVTDASNGVCVVRIEHTDLAADPGGHVDFGLLVRDDPGGADIDRDEPTRGKLDLVLELVDVP